MDKYQKFGLSVLVLVTTATVFLKVGQFQMKDEAYKIYAAKLGDLKTAVCGGNPVDNWLDAFKSTSSAEDEIKACAVKINKTISSQQAEITADKRVMDAGAVEISLFEKQHTKAKDHETEELFYISGAMDDQFCRVTVDSPFHKQACEALTKHETEWRAHEAKRGENQ